MKTTKLVLTVLFSHLLQSLPVYGMRNTIVAQQNCNDLERVSQNFREIKSKKRYLSELRATIERDLITKNAKVFADAISTKAVATLRKMYDDLHVDHKYEDKIVQEIYFAAMNQIVRNNELYSLLSLVWGIYQKNDLKIFEIMLNIQVPLFYAIRRRRDDDISNFLLHYSFMLYKLLNDDMYKRTGLNLQLNVNIVINELPEALRHFLFEEYFCFLNYKYDNYLYTIGTSFLLWKDNKTMGKKGFIKAEVTEVSTDGEFQARLLSTHYNKYYSMNSNELWSIKFINTDLVNIYQNTTELCAIDEDVSTYYRDVIGQTSDLSSGSACLWRLGQCDFS